MASFSVSCPKSPAFSLCGGSGQQNSQQHQLQQSKISFHPAPRSRPSLLSGSSLDHLALLRSQGPSLNRFSVWKVHAQPNEVSCTPYSKFLASIKCLLWPILNIVSTSKVVAEKSSNSSPVPLIKLDVPSSEENCGPVEEPALQSTVPDASSISAFMTQVADLVKLVDSRDIMELQLKQLDCELIIRKKEALPQPPSAAPVMMQPHPHQSILPSQPSPAQAIASPSPGPAPVTPLSAPSLPAPAKISKSSRPPLKCPMAGTFYRSPGPGEPPFVKVGDKVQQGQVVCIIEAMKLMNEIEADQSGTLVEILAEDGKPVSVDTPLFAIEP
ncbi:hypothetical protein HHK36_007329 [Tetracentron sinense]|uniref:Biotin carboxyl carrier protein of acetyl-CoA carboxylase n=1 Tax=Tetracentron sinense TaxID=13715 RepID=A0A834ZTC2_TETSI|nr:hypothetical protein HHK36_007329 [Tetracentron sinense]